MKQKRSFSVLHIAGGRSSLVEPTVFQAAGPSPESIQSTVDEAPGGNDTPRRDIVMMDDFIYGEPEAIQ